MNATLFYSGSWRSNNCFESGLKRDLMNNRPGAAELRALHVPHKRKSWFNLRNLSLPSLAVKLRPYAVLQITKSALRGFRNDKQSSRSLVLHMQWPTTKRRPCRPSNKSLATQHSNRYSLTCIHPRLNRFRLDESLSEPRVLAVFKRIRGILMDRVRIEINTFHCSNFTVSLIIFRCDTPAI